MYLLGFGRLLVGSYSPDFRNLSGYQSMKPRHSDKVANHGGVALYQVPDFVFCFYCICCCSHQKRGWLLSAWLMAELWYTTLNMMKLWWHLDRTTDRLPPSASALVIITHCLLLFLLLGIHFSVLGQNFQATISKSLSKIPGRFLCLGKLRKECAFLKHREKKSYQDFEKIFRDIFSKVLTLT